MKLSGRSNIIAYGMAPALKAACARLGLTALTRPAPPGVLLLGENVLVPSTAGTYGQSYGAIIYVVRPCGQLAVPVICRRAWGQALIPCAPEGHGLWADIAQGIQVAGDSVAESRFTLDGAVTAARKWLMQHGCSGFRASSPVGCAVLTGPGHLTVVSPSCPPPPPVTGAVSPLALRQVYVQTVYRYAA